MATTRQGRDDPPMRTGDDTPGYRALRRGRVSLAGQIYLVTFVTHQRQWLFSDAGRAAIACDAMLDGRLWDGARLLAWTLMPDHWHGLIELDDRLELASVVGRMKANSARILREADPGIAQVWAAGFHDHALRCDENLVVAARYIVLNPVRAGLTRRIADYPWWGAIWVEGRASGLTPLPQGGGGPDFRPA
jgi:REP element-mobilizing transposase RayT